MSDIGQEAERSLRTWTRRLDRVYISRLVEQYGVPCLRRSLGLNFSEVHEESHGDGFIVRDYVPIEVIHLRSFGCSGNPILSVNSSPHKPRVKIRKVRHRHDHWRTMIIKKSQRPRHNLVQFKVIDLCRQNLFLP